MFADVWEDSPASVFRVEEQAKQEPCVSKHLQDYTVRHPRAVFFKIIAVGTSDLTIFAASFRDIFSATFSKINGWEIHEYGNTAEYDGRHHICTFSDYHTSVYTTGCDFINR
jgi:hypothetical protein